MPTKSRGIYPNNLYHIYNRATEKRRIFYSPRDYNQFLNKMFDYKHQTKIRILSYAILPNHFHMLLEEPSKGTPGVKLSKHYKNNVNQYYRSKISKFTALLSNSYTKYFNNNHNHSGRIFQGPFKSKFINDDSYFQTILTYINLNPLKHKLVKNIEDWEYTSHFELLEKIQKKFTDKNLFIDSKIYKRIIKSNINKIKKINIEFN